MISKRKFVKLSFIFFIFFMVGFLAAKFILASISNPVLLKPIATTSLVKSVPDLPEISGWLAWWREEDGVKLCQKYADSLASVSPFWFFLNQDFAVEEKNEASPNTEVGDFPFVSASFLPASDLSTGGALLRRENKTDKKAIVQKLKEKGLKVYLTFGSELTGHQLDPFFEDNDLQESVAKNLINKTIGLEADGIDIDLEDIPQSNEKGFNNFLQTMANKTKENNLFLIVTVHAQTGRDGWEGVKGQNLKFISQLADEVRVMVYDRHQISSGPGAISPDDWFKEVILYSQRFIDREKLVIGLPAYGYIWYDNGQVEGLQYDEFMAKVADKDYTLKRDSYSSELVFEGQDYVGWLADSQSLIDKINLGRLLGINRFIIWNLSGMDERFFSQNWE